MLLLMLRKVGEKMNNEELFNTNILRPRIMNLEYENLNEIELESEIKRIILKKLSRASNKCFHLSS